MPISVVVPNLSKHC